MCADRLDLLVIGGGPAGFASARAFRDAGGQGAVAIVAAEERMPYRRPPLTKELLRGEMNESELPLADDFWLTDNDVRLIGGRAVRLDPDRRRVTLEGNRDLEYSTCVLATGAEPRPLTVPGADDPAVLVLRNLNHLRELEARLAHGGSVVVVGSGFIGCEVAASLRIRGHPVSMVSDERLPNIGRLGHEIAGRLSSWLEESETSLHLGNPVDQVVRHPGGLEISAGDERLIGAVVLVAMGVAPRSGLAARAGAALCEDGAIRTDASMRTSVDGVLAAGDVAFAHNALAGRALRVEHWGDALKQGEVAGKTAAGEEAVWEDVPGFWSTIGRHTLKYSAWEDGFEEVVVDDHPNGGFTAWYRAADRLVGVLTYQADEDYERGRERIARDAEKD